MTDPAASGDPPAAAAPRGTRWRSRLAGEAWGLALLACSLAFWAWQLAPERTIGRWPPNDGVLHIAASERLAASLGAGEPLLEPWVSEWSLGYPLWRSYQPLPHLVAALAMRAAAAVAEPAATFATLHYLLLVLLPASVYAGARLLGMSPVAAGLAAVFVNLPSASGEPGRYGLGLGSTTWRGSGLFTQVAALHLLVLALGATARALDGGGRRWGAAILLAATALSHIIFGYVAFVSAALLALVGPPGERPRRLVRLAGTVAGALVLLLWFVVPLFAGRQEINHSRWEAAVKWDSYGAGFVLRELASGRLLDAERPPVLTGLVALGAVLAGWAAWRRRDPVARRLLALTALWLALFFGRDTWGHLLRLLLVPADLHLHRLQAAFELCAMLLAAWGVDAAVARARRRQPALALAGTTLLAFAVAYLAQDRARYLQWNTRWGQENLAALAAERGDVDAALAAVRELTGQRPGRVSAGLAAAWGRRFTVGSMPFYALLSRAHLDQASFLYHSMSLTSEVMTLRGHEDRAHNTAFGIRAIVAPASMAMPPDLVPYGRFGRFAVYEASPEGYFGLVDVGGRFTGPRSRWYDVHAAWLASPHLRQGVVLAVGDHPPAPGVPTFDDPAALPPLVPGGPCGELAWERKRGERYAAGLRLTRPCHAFVKITWHPGLRATVDGRQAPLLRVTPGFGAVPVPAGSHEVAVEYHPGPLKPALLVFGVLVFGIAVAATPRLPGIRRGEERARTALEAAERRLARPRVVASLALLALGVLALHPLFRGRLVVGHDALEYPPRLTEMMRVLGDGHLPPVWAPDLGNGFGQPLFEFAPPLLYLLAAPLRAAGASLSDAVQLTLAALFLLGGAAVYRLARRSRAPRDAAVAVAVTWLVSPYVALDLFVRAAFAEAAAVALFPLALLALLRALAEPTARRVAAAGAAVALVPLAHFPAALLILPALGVIALADGWREGRLARSAAAATAAFATALLLSAFSWLPALVEKRFVKIELLRQEFLHWRLHGVVPHQLLWSPWGHGISVEGTGDGMSFMIGPLHLLAALAGLTLALRSPSRRERLGAVTLAALAAAAAWTSTTWSAPLWERLPLLQYIAFPWRALLLPSLFCSLLALPLLRRLPPAGRVALLAAIVAVNLPHATPQRFYDFPDSRYAPEAIARTGVNTTTREEYEPHWVAQRPPYDPVRLRGDGAPLELLEQELASHRQRFRVRAVVATTAEANTFFFPGWTATVDGDEVPVTVVPGRGTMAISVPAGDHVVELRLRATPVRRAAFVASCAGALAVLLGLLLGAQGRRGGSAAPPRPVASNASR